MSGTFTETVVGIAAIWIWALGVIVTARLIEPKPYGHARRVLSILVWPVALFVRAADAALDVLCKWLTEKVLP